MADNCKYKIKGLPGEYTEEELKAYLAKGGQAYFQKIKSEMNVSDINRKNADKLIEGIINRSTNKAKVIDYIKSLSLSDETKSKVIDYINQQLKDKNRGSYEGLDENEKNFYDYWQDRFKNKELTYEQVMRQLGSIADRQPTQELRDKYNAIRNIFYAQNAKKAERQERKEAAKEIESFEDEINSQELGLSDEVLTRFQSVERIAEKGIVNLMNDTSLLKENDQIQAAFDLAEYGNDLNNLLLKFQLQYGEKDYIKKMSDFVKDENNKTEARAAVSIALNNHLQNLITDSKNNYERIRLTQLLTENAYESQKLGRKASLLLNAFRVYNGLTDAQKSWIGIVTPEKASQLETIKEALGTEVSDEDLLADEQGQLNLFEEQEKKKEEEKPVKKPGYFDRKKIKQDAKDTPVPSKDKLKNDIEEQNKKCK